MKTKIKNKNPIKLTIIIIIVIKLYEKGKGGKEIKALTRYLQNIPHIGQKQFEDKWFREVESDIMNRPSTNSPGC